MNPDTGHLVSTAGMDERERKALRGDGYMEVPAGHLSRRAAKLLGRNEAVHVRLSDPLTKAVRKKRARQKKAAKIARRSNRRGA